MQLWRSGLSAATVAIFTALSGAAQIYGPAVAQGSALTKGAAEQLETSLKTNPHDLAVRARLLGYYSAHAAQDPGMRGARLGQIEWLIENHPATLLLRDQVAKLQPSDFAAPYGDYLQSLRRAWQQQIDRQPDDAVVIENAIRSLGYVEVNSPDVGRLVGYLKRLRALEPGDPEWALDLAGLYAVGLPRGLAPGAASDAKQFVAATTAELEKSSDAAVVGLTGAVVYEGSRQASVPAIAPIMRLSESLLRRAAALNSKNPGWLRLLDSPAPANSAELGAALTETLQESDLWPGGAVPAMTVPPDAVSLSQSSGVYYRGLGSSVFTLIGTRTSLLFESLPSNAVGAACSVRFNALIGLDGRVKTLQVAAFDHLNIPFVAAARNAIREIHYQPTSVNGHPVEVVTHIDMTCPKQILNPTKVERTPAQPNTPAAGAAGGPGGPLGGVIGAASSPPQNGDKSSAEPARLGESANPGPIQQVAPVYPAVAKQARIQGVVRLKVLVGKDGKVESVSVIEGHPLLRSAAIDAVKQWVYTPMVLNGAPVEVQTEAEVNFTLSK